MPSKLNVFAVASRTGKRVHANECNKRDEEAYPRGHFACIDCASEVFIRRGNLRAWHFAHYNASDDQKCPHQNGGETLEHYDAKHFIAKNIGRCEFVVQKCYGCGRRKEFAKHMANGRILPGSHCMAEVEGRIHNTDRIADVALTDAVTNRQVAAVEVFHTHRVDADKRRECMQQGIAVLEVTTDEVEKVRMRHNEPGRMLPFRTTDMVYKLCAMCAWNTEVVQEFRRVSNVWQEYDIAWMHYGEKLALQLKQERLRALRKRKRAEGREEAERRLHEQATTDTKKFVKHSGPCKGKCKVCGDWMFEDNTGALCEIESRTMSEASWDHLFHEDEEKYRKRYMKGRSYNTVLLHRKCCADCPLCMEECTLTQIARFGLCVCCNNN